MKKVLAILLSVLTLCSLPLSAFAEGTDDGRADSKALAFIQNLTETDKWSLDLRIENSEEPVSVTLYKNGGAYAVDGRFMGILITRVVITEEETWIASPLVLPFICSTVDPEDYGLSVKVEMPDDLAEALMDPDLTYTWVEENGMRKETLSSDEEVLSFEFEGDRVSRIEINGTVFLVDRFEASVPLRVFRRPPINLMLFADLFSRLFQLFFTPAI